MITKSRVLRRTFSGVAAGAIFGLTAAAAHAQLSFSFANDPDINPLALAGFQAAANRWSSVITDPITINLNIGFTALGPGVLGSTGSTAMTVNYSAFKSALTADRTSASDNSAVGSLSNSSSVDLLLNRTSNNPYGSGSALPYIDDDGSANNSTIRLNLANARALGLYQASGGVADASITFSSAFAFDFNPDDGITAGMFDFVGIATHEIGHALGFVSGVDTLDINSPPGNGPFASNQFTFVRPLDLFRYSTDSAAMGVIDWTADDRDKYFSLDGGITKLASFSTGTNFGDGRQASHWKDNVGLGIMDPTAAPGERLQFSIYDLQAMDVIGYNLAPIPEPATTALAGMGFLGLAIGLRRFRRKS